MDAAPRETIDRLAAAGLRGRGGGWFPAARKWRAAAVEDGPRVVVGNGAEGEPGSVKDRFLMLTRPAEVIAGLEIAARTLAAEEAHIYLKGSFAAPAAALAAAARHAGIGLRIHRGADTYVAGEETAVLEAIEGRQAWPRAKPPLPCAVGLRGRPTLVHNVETLLRVPEALADPPAFRQAERTLVSLWGHVRRPGVFEVPLGTPLREVVERYGEGAPAGIGFYFPAGPSALPLLATEGGTPLDPDELRARGSGLGTAALLVVREGACPVSLASSLASFFARESCGQCPPCAVGTSNLARVLGAVEAGEARPRDLDTLAEVAGFMGDHGYCAHGRTAAAVVTGLLRRCAAAVQAHLRAARCPGPDGQLDPFHPSSPERAAIEATLEGASPLP